MLWGFATCFPRLWCTSKPFCSSTRMLEMAGRQLDACFDDGFVGKSLVPNVVWVQEECPDVDRGLMPAVPSAKCKVGPSSSQKRRVGCSPHWAPPAMWLLVLVAVGFGSSLSRIAPRPAMGCQNWPRQEKCCLFSWCCNGASPCWFSLPAPTRSSRWKAGWTSCTSSWTRTPSTTSSTSSSSSS